MIKMKAGTFGLPVNGIVKPMTKESGPFKASPEQEERLVKQGLAEYVIDGTPIGFDEAPEDLTDEVETEEETPLKPLEDLTTSELRALGKEYGLTFKVGTTKAEMVNAIADAQTAIALEGETTEDDGEDAPTFDAAEAVE